MPRTVGKQERGSGHGENFLKKEDVTDAVEPANLNLLHQYQKETKTSHQTGTVHEC
jgi:hypothetical protein